MMLNVILAVAIGVLGAFGQVGGPTRPGGGTLDSRFPHKPNQCFTSGDCPGNGVCCGADPLSGAPGVCVGVCG